MYILNDEGLKQLSLYISKKVAETVGIHPKTVSELKKNRKPVNKQTAYCLTKFFDSNAEIEHFFIRN